MGYEHGSIFIYNKKFWLFEGYSTDVNMKQTYKLRGVDGIQREVLASDCIFLLSPGEIDYTKL